MFRNPDNDLSPIEIAAGYVESGLKVIPIPHRKKAPVLHNWTTLDVTSETLSEYFGVTAINIGVRLGAPSNNLIDIDLDCYEARVLAPDFLPATITFGRAGAPQSHYLYYVEPLVDTEKFALPGNNGGMLLEIRGTGHQTVFPGSVHHTGESITWESANVSEPARTTAVELRLAAAKLAAAALLLRIWKAGIRDELATALTGALLREGWPQEEADALIRSVADHAGDEGAKERLKARRLAASLEHGKAVPGWAKVTELVGSTVTRKLRDWLRKENTNLGASTEELIDELNLKHAVVPLGGQVRIQTEERDPATGFLSVSYMAVHHLHTLYANQQVMVGTRPTPISDVWLKSPRRRGYRGVVFRPFRFGHVEQPDGFYNRFQGFPVAPVKGDWSLYREHLLEVICAGNEDHFDYLLRWMAHAIQFPAERLGVAVVLRGKQGTGKGQAVEYFARLFGPHFIHVSSPHHLLGNFNAHLEDKLLVFGDEAFWAGDKAAEGKLKAMITERQHVVERKGIDAVFMANYARVIAASNSDWVVPAGPEERRFFVLDVSDRRMQDHEYFERLKSQMENGGTAALMHALMSIDLSTRNLRLIPKTKALLEQKLQSLDSVDEWWFTCLDAGAVDPKHASWPTTPVPTADLHGHYLAHARQQNCRYPRGLTSFTMRLRKIMPRFDVKKITIDGERMNAYELPSLEKSRAFFDELMREEFEWSEGSAAIRTRLPFE